MMWLRQRKRGNKRLAKRQPKGSLKTMGSLKTPRLPRHQTKQQMNTPNRKQQKTTPRSLKPNNSPPAKR